MKLILRLNEIWIGGKFFVRPNRHCGRVWAFLGSSSFPVTHEKIKLSKTNYLYGRHKCNIQNFIFFSLILQKNNDTASSLQVMYQITITKMAKYNKSKINCVLFLYPLCNGQYKHFSISCARAINGTIFIIFINDLTLSMWSNKVKWTFLNFTFSYNPTCVQEK